MKNMTLGEFAEHIQKFPEYGELPMYLARDSEGNSFAPFCGDFEVMDWYEIVEYPKVQGEEKVAVFWPDW